MVLAYDPRGPPGPTNGKAAGSTGPRSQDNSYFLRPSLRYNVKSLDSKASRPTKPSRAGSWPWVTSRRIRGQAGSRTGMPTTGRRADAIDGGSCDPARP